MVNSNSQYKITRRGAIKSIGAMSLIAGSGGSSFLLASSAKASALGVASEGQMRVLITAIVQEGQWENLEGFLQLALLKTRGFKGVFDVSVLYDTGTRTLTLIEDWRSRSHHQAYIAHVTQNGAMEQFMDFFANGTNYVLLQQVANLETLLLLHFFIVVFNMP